MVNGAWRTERLRLSDKLPMFGQPKIVRPFENLKKSDDDFIRDATPCVSVTRIAGE